MRRLTGASAMWARRLPDKEIGLAPGDER